MKVLFFAPLAMLMVMEIALSRQTEGISVQGVVLRAETNEPVAKANVELRRAGENSASYDAATADDGKFILRNASPGRYELIVKRTGYVPAEYGQRAAGGPGQQITLANGQPPRTVTILMTPTAAISGRIYDRFGEPLIGAEVRAMKAFYQEGARVVTLMQSTLTNDLGEYRLFWLPPGRYFVSATWIDAGNAPYTVINDARGDDPPRFPHPRPEQDYTLAPIPPLRTATEENDVYVPVYFPTTRDQRAASPIDLRPGATFGGVDITLEPVRVHRIRGTVVDATTGQVLRDADILRSDNPPDYIADWKLLFASGNLPRPGVHDRTTGIFEMREVIPGNYLLIANRDELSGRVAVEVRDGDLENVVIPIAAGFSLSARVKIEGRSATKNDPDLAKLRVSLRADPFIPNLREPSEARAADGSLTLKNTAAGDYRVRVEPILNLAGDAMARQSIAPGLYVKSIRLGNTDVLNAGLHLSQQPSDPLEIVVGTNPGSLNGSVLDEKQQRVPNILVLLAPDIAHRNRFDLFKTASTDASGRFQLESVPPGDYKLFAWEEVESEAWQDPDFMMSYENRGKPIRVGEGTKETVDLAIISAADIR